LKLRFVELSKHLLARVGWRASRIKFIYDSEWLAISPNQRRGYEDVGALGLNGQKHAIGHQM
jgi:hypothetical protein